MWYPKIIEIPPFEIRVSPLLHFGCLFQVQRDVSPSGMNYLEGFEQGNSNLVGSPFNGEDTCDSVAYENEGSKPVLEVVIILLDDCKSCSFNVGDIKIRKACFTHPSSICSSLSTSRISISITNVLCLAGFVGINGKPASCLSTSTCAKLASYVQGDLFPSRIEPQCHLGE
ncbi:hypothetical protein SLE2022_265110 [Rubroshorea leprosula]